MDFRWFYKGKLLKPYCNFIENQWIWKIIFGNITSIGNTFQNRILQNPSRISYPFSKTLSLPNLTLWKVVSSLQLAQFRTADPEDFCHQTLCFQTPPIRGIPNGSPPPSSRFQPNTRGGEPSDLARFGDPFLAVSPLEIAILEAQNPNFFAPAAGQILARSLRQEGGGWTLKCTRPVLTVTGQKKYFFWPPRNFQNNWSFILNFFLPLFYFVWKRWISHFADVGFPKFGRKSDLKLNSLKLA